MKQWFGCQNIKHPFESILYLRDLGTLWLAGIFPLAMMRLRDYLNVTCVLLGAHRLW